MKKYIVSFLVIVSPLLGLAQKLNNGDKAIVSSKVDTLIMKFLQKSALSEYPGLKKRNEKMFKEFKGLFTNDASIFDDMNGVFDFQLAKAGKFPYKLETKPRVDYFDGLVDDFENGFVINNKRININYDNFDEGTIKVALERQIEGTSFKGYKFQNNDTLLLTLSILKDKAVKISKIDAIGSNLKVMNDDDLDGVTNDKDECPKTFGKISLSGCPDKDEDGIPDRKDDCPDLPGLEANNGCPATTFAYRYVFSASAGYMLNKTALTTPTFNQLGYSQINKDETENYKSNLGEVVNPKFKGGFGLSANIAFYIGKNKQTRNKGISIGISSVNYKADYSIINAKYVFKETDGGNHTYARIVNIHDESEALTFNIINIPVLFKYKGRFGTAWAYEFSAGASYLLFTTKSVYNATVSFEGIYNTSNTYDPHNLNDPSNLNLTSDYIIAHTANHDPNAAATLYSELRGSDGGYDFWYRQKIEGSTPVKARTGIAFDAGADLFYHVTSKIAIKLGGTYVYAPVVKNKADNNYEMVNKSKEGGFPFHSIYDSAARSSFTSFGLNLGIIVGL